jgi:phosphoribosylanthranilate isomerase
VRPRVKICGLTRPEDVALAAGLGADALGFIFAPSKRQLGLEQARALAAAVPVWVSRVGVFGPAEREDAAGLAEACGLDTLQFHGEPDPSLLSAQRGRFRVVQAVGVGEDTPAALRARLAALAPHVDALLLDTARPGQLGGTGEVFDWAALEALALPCPLIVAGGLNAGNVSTLLTQHQPWGVDVASGVESAPGIKDADQLRAFFAAVASAC